MTLRFCEFLYTIREVFLFYIKTAAGGSISERHNYGMFGFVKKNSYLIVRLILNQIGMTIFGLMTSMAAAAVDNALAGGGEVQRTCMIWVSVFSIVFYMYINYMAMKEEGQKDKIRLDAGRAEYTPLRGLFIGIWGSVLNVILGIVITVLSVVITVSPEAADSVGGILGGSKLIESVILAMYWGLMLGASGVQTIAEVPFFWFLIIPLPTVAVSAVAYWFGLSDVNIFRYVKKFFTPENSKK